MALNGAELFIWPVSTGASGHDTPSGTFTPFRLEKDHFSKEWDDAPMPHSVFFTRKGHAIHGSNHLKAIGTPASHGCVRLEPKNAAVLFDLVKQEGLSNVRVSITGEIPSRSRRRRWRGARRRTTASPAASPPAASTTMKTPSPRFPQLPRARNGSCANTATAGPISTASGPYYYQQPR